MRAVHSSDFVLLGFFKLFFFFLGLDCPCLGQKHDFTHSV